MAELDAKFNEVVKKVQEAADALSKLSNEKKLEIYALYKQATVGDVNTDRPGMFDQKGRAKWDAWSGKKGMGSEEAKQAYIEIGEAVL